MQNTTSQTMEGLWIDITILKNPNLSLQEKVTLAIIKALDKSNGCFASNKYFADILQVTPKRASDIIQSLISKNYITSTIENHYKRTLRVAIPQQEEIQSDEIQDEKIIPFKPKKKPLMWRGRDLSNLAGEVLERLKKRFPEIEILLQGGTIDESQPAAFRTNEQLQSTYREVSSEWIGISQLQFT